MFCLLLQAGQELDESQIDESQSHFQLDFRDLSFSICLMIISDSFSFSVSR
jgi:hypothetical protein